MIGASDLMLATLRKTPFSDSAWLFEWKYDGFRCLIRKSGDHVELVSRLGNVLNQSFPDIVGAVSRVQGSFVWDAELTVDTNGLPNFPMLQIRAKTRSAKNVPAAARAHPARLYVFDLLSIGDRDIRGLPLSARKPMLRDTFDDCQALVYVSGVIGVGTEVFELVKKHGFEGMLAKRLGSSYQRGRSRDWLKVKHAGYGRPAALDWGAKG